MTIEELEAWLASARTISAASGQVIDDYDVIINGTPVEDIRIDHGDNTLWFTV